MKKQQGQPGSLSDAAAAKRRDTGKRRETRNQLPKVARGSNEADYVHGGGNKKSENESEREVQHERPR